MKTQAIPASGTAKSPPTTQPIARTGAGAT